MNMKWHHIIIFLILIIALVLGAIYWQRVLFRQELNKINNQSIVPAETTMSASARLITPTPIATPTPIPDAQPTAPAAHALQQTVAEQLKPVLDSTCPDTALVKTLTGVDVQRVATEPCAFVWRGASNSTVNATCPSGFVCTWDVVNDVVVVHLGVNQSATIRAGTWRYINAYPPSDAVHDVCVLYAKEKAFGLSENPPFEVRFQSVTDGTLGPVGPQSCDN